MKTETARRRVLDPTIYPVEEKVGEEILQRLIMEFLRPLLQRWLDARGVKALVGADQYMYYRQHDSTARVAPDIYVLPGVASDTPVRVWKVWETGIVPSFGLEVVSLDRDKDYFEAPGRYDQLGTPEVIFFDPHYRVQRDRVRWQVYRRVGRRGLVCVEATQAERVRSKQLGCWFVAVGEGNATRVRIATGARGQEMVPTEAEVERAAKEAERAAKEAERAAKEEALAAREAALARVRELEDALRKRERPLRRR